MCGNFGFSGKEGKKANIKKLSILGLYNVTRGTDSCGYYYSGNLAKGINANAVWGNFIDENKITKGDLPCETFIGHTRKSTSGQNTEQNAHPHVVDNYVQAHNGVLKNHWELCRKYGVDHTKIHVDSIGLAHLIKKKGFSILEEYDGTAALCFTFTDDPTSLYLYHGASRKVKDGELYEERPLFILNQPEGIYYSSLEESLTFISDNKSKPYQLPHNQVFKITNGILTDYNYIVNREDANLIKSYIPVNTYSTAKELPFNNFVTQIEAQAKMSILLESIPLEKATQDLYFRKGRFMRAENILLNGVYYIDRTGKLYINKEVDVNKLIETYYFVRGIMIKDKKTYDKCLAENPDINLNLGKNLAFYLSSYSQYPITCIDGEGILVSEELKRNWYKNGKLYTGCITTKFSKRKYLVKNGQLISIVRTNENDKVAIDNIKIYINYTVDNFKAKNQNTLMNEIINEVSEWADKKITENTDIKKIPESFLMFIDLFNLGFYNITISEKIIEDDTTTVLKDLIKLKLTFHEYLLDQGNHTFGKINNIKHCFKNYSEDELMSMVNRYHFINFEDKETETIDTEFQEIDNKALINYENKKKEDGDKLYNLYEELKGVSTDYNEILNEISSLTDNEVAQTLAFKGEQIIQSMESIYKEVGDKILPF